MCNDALHPFLQALPKCEHHLHLEGCLTPDLLFKLAANNGIHLPTDDPAFASIASLRKRYNEFTDLEDFLHYYYLGMSVLRNEADFEYLAWDYFEHAAADGVEHAELFFDPQAHTSRGVTFEVVLSGFTAARNRAAKEFGISSELICCFLRDLPVSDALAIFKLEEFQSAISRGDIVGIGLDSAEIGYPPEPFKDIYEQAKDLKIRRTAHAGESGPVSHIGESIDVLDIQRVDHGIRLIEDPKLLKRVADEKILLTVCPVSNVLLRCAKSVAELPIRTFLDSGVAFSINSDDPAYFGSHYILDNFCAVQEAFGLSVKEWERIVEASIRGSWCDYGRKEELLRRLRKVIEMQV